MATLIYLASPYSKYADGRNNAEYITSVKAAELMMQGHCIFAPIPHSHAIEMAGIYERKFIGRKDGDWWLKQDFAVLERCDELWVYQMPGWEDSYGVRKEIEFAKEKGIPIKYLEYESQSVGA